MGEYARWRRKLVRERSRVREWWPDMTPAQVEAEARARVRYRETHPRVRIDGTLAEYLERQAEMVVMPGGRRLSAEAYARSIERNRARRQRPEVKAERARRDAERRAAARDGTVAAGHRASGSVIVGQSWQRSFWQAAARRSAARGTVHPWVLDDLVRKAERDQRARIRAESVIHSDARSRP